MLRLPNLNRPLSKHHEFCTAVALRVMSIWHDQGVEKYGFNPVMTYNGEPNHHINNHASGSGKIKDDAGHYYYVSHPPLSYYLPYAILTAIGLSPDALFLQSFQLVIHLLSVMLVYLIAWELLPRKAQPHLSLPLLAASLYLFAPATLWFQANVYMADTLVQLFFAGTLLVLLRMWGSNGSRAGMKIVVALLVFAMCYTHWLGYFVVATFLVGLVMKQLRSFIGKQVVLPSLTGAVIALSLMGYQYAQIAGLDAYIAEMFHRFSIRSSGQALSLSGFTSHLGTLFFNYAANHLPLLLLLISMVIIGRFIKAVRFRFQPVQVFFLYIAFLPVLLLHLVLLDYSVHDFTTLYATVGFCGLFVMLSSSFSSFTNSRAMIIAGIAVIGLSIGQYYYINRPGERSLRGDRYHQHKTVAEKIRQLSANNEVLFLLNHEPSPQLIYYSERNMLTVANSQEARQFLHQHQRTKGLLLTIDKRNVKIKQRINR